MEISGSSVLVTGANRGIGLALIKRFLDLRASEVYATYRSEENRIDLENLDKRVVPIHLDLSNSETVDNLPLKIKSLNILVNNAGIFTGADLLEDTETQLQNDLETNLFGTLAVTKKILPIIKKANSGAIVNISSIAALAAMPSFGGYSISKAAVHSLTQSLRGKMSDSPISVHGVYPGPVATRLTEGFEMETTPAEIVAENIIKGIEHGQEDIFPDKMSEHLGPVYLSSPKTLEINFASF